MTRAVLFCLALIGVCVGVTAQLEASTFGGTNPDTGTAGAVGTQPVGVPGAAPTAAPGMQAERQQGPYYGDLDLSNPAFVSRPIQLLSESPDHARLLIVDEGLAFLRAIGDMPLSVVVTAGPARTGKSFLCNHILGVEHGTDDGNLREGRGFAIGHNPTPQTMGVWFWGRPEVIDLGEGRGKVAQVHMDTEGFAALGALSESYDPKLCLYSVLFASSFYYNIKGLIDMNQIKFLSTVAMFDDVFSAKFNVSFPLAPPFWILQGFAARLSKFDPPTAEGYLDYAYSKKDEASLDGGATGLKTYNSIIDMILRKFPNQTAPRIMLMKRPHPTVDTADYELADFDFTELAPAYQKQIVELRALIRSRAAPKSFHNFTVTGNSMSELTRRLIPAMNDVDGDAPGIIREIASLVADECAAMYREGIDAVPLPAPDAAIDAIHVTSRDSAFVTYEEKCVGGADLAQNSLARDGLARNISVTHEFRRANNTHVAAQHCDALLHAKLHELNRFNPDTVEFGEATAGAAWAGEDGNGVTLEDTINSALQELRTRCHVPPGDLAQKIAQYTSAAGFAQALVSATRSKQAVEAFAKACGTVLGVCLLCRVLFWVMSFCVAVPESLQRVLGGATAVSGLCLLAAMAHMMSLLHKAFASVGYEVTAEELDAAFAHATVVMRRGLWALGIFAGNSKQIVAHAAFVFIDVARVVKAAKPPLLSLLEPHLMGDVEARLEWMFYMTSGVLLSVLVHRLLRSGYSKLAVAAVVLSAAVYACGAHEDAVLAWLASSSTDASAAAAAGSQFDRPTTAQGLGLGDEL